MSRKYRYGHRTVKRHHVVLLTLFVCLVIGGGAAFLIVRDIRSNQSGPVAGESKTVGQVTGSDSKKMTVTEPLYTMQLPGDWKEKSRVNTAAETSVTWRATKKNDDARWLTVYIDKIPAQKSINRLLPVSSQKDRLLLGDISDNCITFTEGGSFDASKAAQNKDKQARWSGVDFICNLPSILENQVGTGSSEGINQVTLTGTKGPHKYFFLYVDHDIQPDYSIFTDALSSFQAR